MSVPHASRLCRRGALVAAALVARAAPSRRPARPHAALARLHAPACGPPYDMGVTARLGRGGIMRWARRKQGGKGARKARGGKACRTRWATHEADGSSVPITAIVHLVPRPSYLTRGALVRPVGAARAALARAALARADLARASLAGVAPSRFPARPHTALRLGEVATPPTHAVIVPSPPRLRASGAELRAARRRIASIAPAVAAVAVVPARPLVSRRHWPAALVQLARGAGAHLPRIRHVVVDHVHCRALSVVEGVLARWLAALVLIAHAIGAPVIIPRAARAAAGRGALAATAGVAVVPPARRPASRVAALILIAHAIGAPVIILRAARAAAGRGALVVAAGVAVVAPA